MKTIAIIGGGPAAIMLAAMLDETKFNVHIYEKNATVGRKFLVAGDGGFNLTHSEDIKTFVTRYTPSDFLEEALRAFSNKDLCDWLSSIGIETYTGSSKRIFPIKGIKPIEVLNAILKRLEQKKVTIHTLHKWLGWTNENALLFAHKESDVVVTADKVVFALGGASWKVTGSDGQWLKLFQKKDILTNVFQASNCGYTVSWTNDFIEKFEGAWLKNISVSCDGIHKKGELVLSKSGIEGGAIYALSPQIRTQFECNSKAEIKIDFKPSVSIEVLIEKLSIQSNKSVTQQLKTELNLSDVQIALLKSHVSKEAFLQPNLLAEHIKSFNVPVTGIAQIDEAISTVGGIALSEVDHTFQLNRLPNQYIIGEMLDWDAPTGGYLLQGCFCMGAWVAAKFNQ
ncbi:TIGR03862 family flavoprotein [uncultured Cytophaga sp.]|uniref:NAD(P)/FAD-dependent oxidoreductase n=1 Tax=uncultured Cytophaga sp. TaxID=160238 RepID=UPI002631786E|nr:TIGR03862 family flavoprotein [uncultured Cytophaga sp.]